LLFEILTLFAVKKIKRMKREKNAIHATIPIKIIATFISYNVNKILLYSCIFNDCSKEAVTKINKELEFFKSQRNIFKKKIK
jgi:hypothetical protein